MSGNFKALDISVLSVFEEADPGLRWKKLVQEIRLSRSLPLIKSVLDALCANFPEDFKNFSIPDDLDLHSQETAIRAGNWELVLWGPPAKSPAPRERVTLYHRKMGHGLPGLWWEIDQHGRVFLGFLGATTGLSPSTHKALLREAWSKHRQQLWDILKGLDFGFRSEKQIKQLTPGYLDESLGLDSPVLARDPYFRKIYQITLLNTTIADRLARSENLPDLAAQFAVRVYPILRLIASDIRENAARALPLFQAFERAIGKAGKQTGGERAEFSGLCLSRVLASHEFMVVAYPLERNLGVLNRARDLRYRPVIRDTQAANAPAVDGTLFLSWREARTQAFDLLLARIEADAPDSRINQLLEAAQQLQSPDEPEPLLLPGQNNTYLPKHEIAMAKQALSEHGVLCVFGPAGSGKIALAQAIESEVHWIVLDPDGMWWESTSLMQLLETATQEPGRAMTVGLIVEDASRLGSMSLLWSNRNTPFELQHARDSVVFPPNLRLIMVCQRHPGFPVPSLKAGPRPDVLERYLESESSMRPELRQKIVEFYGQLCQRLWIGQQPFMVQTPDQLQANFFTQVLPVIEELLSPEEAQEQVSKFKKILGLE